MGVFRSRLKCCLLYLKCNNDYSVQNDASPRGHWQMREESESGKESEKRCDLRREQKMGGEGQQ